MSYQISIITPVYNAGGLWTRAYESIKRQSLKAVEWLLIDDGSDDGTYEELERLTKEDSRIRLFSQEHRGAGAARNLGLNEAQGDYVAFLDIDDAYYDCNALEKMYIAGVRNEADVIGSYRVTETYDGIKVSPLFREYEIYSPDGRWVDFREYQEDYHFHSYLFHRSFLNKNNLRFPDYKRYQDPVFLLKVLNITKKVLVVPVTLYKYSYGVQNIDVIERNIADLLKGIRDNIIISVSENYSELLKKQVERINVDFYAYIMRNFSCETFDVLREIRQILSEYTGKENLELLPLAHMKDAIAQSVEAFYFDDLSRRYDSLVRPKNMIEDYFIRHGISKIAVYGLGAFGVKLIDDLKESSVTIVAGIDRDKEKKVDIRIVSPDEVKGLECSAVVVTPIWYGDMASRMEKAGGFKVIVLKELIYQLGEEANE